MIIALVIRFSKLGNTLKSMEFYKLCTDIMAMYCSVIWLLH